METTGVPRVLLVVNSLGYGGTERMIERMTMHLCAAGRVRYTVCSLGDEGPIGSRLRAAGIEVVALGLRGGALRQVIGGALRLRPLLRSRRFDLVHSFLYRSHCAARLARLALSPRLPLLSAERCLGDNRGFVTRWVNRLTGRMSDRILAVSAAVGRIVVQHHGVPPDRVAVVPNGIETVSADPRARQRLRRALGLAEGETLLLFLGRLHREKGPDLLVEALSLLQGMKPRGFLAVFVGDGAERSDLERRVAALGLRGRVLLRGARHRVDPWIEAADLVVLPSREEGMPVAALEAMMHGRATVATRVGGTPEVVRDGETGLLVPPEDARALARSLLRLIQDPEECRRLGRRGREVAHAEFTIGRMAEATLRQYEILLPGEPAWMRPATAAASGRGD